MEYLVLLFGFSVMRFYKYIGTYFLLSFLVACAGAGSSGDTSGNGDNGGGQGGGKPTEKNHVKTLRVATFGDSTANASSLKSQDISLFQAKLLGHQIIESRKYQLSFYYPTAYLVGNGGIGGETTLSMLHRDNKPLSTHRKSTEDIIALKPQVILFRGGSINDLPHVSESNRDLIVNETYKNHISLVERFTDARIPVLDSGVFGYSFPKGGKAVGGYSKADPTQVKLALTQLNKKFRAYAKTHNKVYFIDPLGTVSDSRGKYFSKMTEDGIHLSLLGSLAMAQKEAQVVTKIFGKSAEKSFEKGGENRYPKTDFSNDVFKVIGGASKNQSKLINGKKYQFIRLQKDGGLELKLPTELANSLEKGKTYGVSLDIIIEKPSKPTTFSLSTRLDLKDTVKGLSERYLLENFGGAVRKLDQKITGRIKLPPFKLNTPINDQSHFRVYISDLSVSTPLTVGVTLLNWVEIPPE